MLKGSAIISTLFLFCSIQTIAQNRPLLELSTVLGPHYVPTSTEIAPSFPLSLNYVYSPRLTAGLMFILEGMPTEHNYYFHHQNYGTSLWDESEDDWYIAYGLGLNLKYNFVTTTYFNFYAQLQANYVSLSIESDTDGERQFDVEANGEVIKTYTSDPLPFQGQKTMTFNLNFGADFRISKTVLLYVQYDLRDITRSLNIYYDIHSYETLVQDGGLEYNDIEDIKYVTNKDQASLRTISLGLRFYLFDRKF